MKNIPLWSNDYLRAVAKTPRLMFKNRFLEKNPVESEEVSAIARPGLRRAISVGDGPIRKVYTSPGAFNGDLFVVSASTLYRVSGSTLTVTSVGALSDYPVGDVSMCATAPIGTTPGYLFIADGQVLWVYTDNGNALGHLQATGAIVTNDTVKIDTVYYKWTSGSVNTGTPAGTSGSPWLVNLGASNTIAITNLFNAINGTGASGTDYSTALTPHPTCKATAYTSSELFVQYATAGIAGNSISTTETGANTAWDGTTLSGGGSPQLRSVEVPDDAGAISVAHINSYVIVVPLQGTDIKGRFYWVEPGENTINPLNFATAERNPDGVNQVVVFGDMFWLMGENTTEPWITTGDATAPMARFKGILFDRGAWQGTAVQVKDSLIVVDEDGAVFQGKNRISNPSIEERIRKAMAAEAVFSNIGL
jgi:hypothetical protein